MAVLTVTAAAHAKGVGGDGYWAAAPQIEIEIKRQFCRHDMALSDLGYFSAEISQ